MLTKHVNAEIAVVTQELTTSELSVVFPKWEIGVSKGVKRKKRSRAMPRIIDDTRWALNTRCKGATKSDTAGPSTVALSLEDLNAPVEGCPIEDAMDDELLACVFMRLNMKDLSASMRTCKRWHRVACKEDVWEHIPLPANVPGALPRYVT